MKIMWWLVLYFVLHLRVICSVSPNSSSSPSPKFCCPEESSALLLFKSTITIDCLVPIECMQSIDSLFSRQCSQSVGSYHKIDSWKKSSDCCSWDGVTCDRLTGHVIGLDLSSSCLCGVIHANSSLFQLRHLQRLNLACNDFGQSEILSNFSQLTKLTQLNLSSSSFMGQVSPELSHLSKLVSLDLSYNYNVQLDQYSFNKLSKNLTELRDLSLDSVNMSLVIPRSLMNLSSSLISLSLPASGLHGMFPTELFNFLSLQFLSLADNKGLTCYLPKSNWSGPLRLLDLGGTGFSGKLPNTVSNLIQLNVLDLSSCNFEGSVPASFWNLTGITYLDLRSNGFMGQVPASISKFSRLTDLYLQENNFSGIFPDVFNNVSKLIHVSLSQNNFSGPLPSSAFTLTELSGLDFSRNLFDGHIPCQLSSIPNLNLLILSYNLLHGRIPSWLFSLPSLFYLDLGNNMLTGHIDSFQWPGSLEFIDLGNNQIGGPIPNSLSELVNLIELNLSSNNFRGVIKSDIFSNLKSINHVDLSHNSRLSLVNSNVNFTLPVLLNFVFSSCNLTEFPTFLGDSQNLVGLDLSNNRISGRISKREMKHCPNLQYLNLSHNFLTTFEQIPLTSVTVLDLRSNLLEGPLMVSAHMGQFILFSDNKLTGEIPSSLCYLRNLTILDLSNNRLSGKIPECLGKGNHYSLSTLNLHGNQLQGPLSPSLVNCSQLEVLDVGDNMMNDTFPHWLAVLPELKVLILRSNRFRGRIDDSKTRFPFPKLRILDISRNGFTGPLPSRLFNNFEAMMQGDNNSVKVEYMGKVNYYQDSVVLTVKGIDVRMDRILTIFTTIDLSSNQFQGQIPEVVGKLNSLIVLNFSLNNLTGNIPLSLWNLTNLESLDLSSNKLAGNIPVQLKELTFLSILNLSYNQLVGPIPRGNQFDTFENNSYIGNLGLCGSPLSEKCSNGDAPEPTPTIVDKEDNESGWFDWKVIMMGYASGLVIGFSIGYITFSTGKQWCFVKVVERWQLNIVRSLKRR